MDANAGRVQAAVERLRLPLLPPAPDLAQPPAVLTWNDLAAEPQIIARGSAGFGRSTVPSVVPSVGAQPNASPS